MKAESKKLAIFTTKKILKLICLMAVVSIASLWLVDQSPIDPVRIYI
jgi:peptide/nickel transport system permease protein